MLISQSSRGCSAGVARFLSILSTLIEAFLEEVMGSIPICSIRPGVSFSLFFVLFA